jgi:hypothetical protein
MLQYSLSDSVLYTLMVSYDTVVFTRIPSDSVFTRSLHDFLQEVSLVILPVIRNFVLNDILSQEDIFSEN